MVTLTDYCYRDRPQKSIKEQAGQWMIAAVALLASACAVDANATLLNRLDAPPAAGLVWSPTGNEIAVTGVAGAINASSIFVLNIGTKEMRPLVVQKYGNVEAQSWTPDGKQLTSTLILAGTSARGYG